MITEENLSDFKTWPLWKHKFLRMGSFSNLLTKILPQVGHPQISANMAYPNGRNG